MPSFDQPDIPSELYGDAIDSFWGDYAFWLTGSYADDLVAAAKERLGNAMTDGQSPTDMIDQLDGLLGDYLPEMDAAGNLVNRPHRIETIARTNAATAVNAGRQQAFEDPDLQDFLTGLRYNAILDSRTRPNHAAWHGVIEPVDFWRAKGVPPSGFNCRCFASPVSVYDGEDVTPEDELPNVNDPTMDIPDPGFVPAQQQEGGGG